MAKDGAKINSYEQERMSRHLNMATEMDFFPHILQYTPFWETDLKKKLYIYSFLKQFHIEQDDCAAQILQSIMACSVYEVEKLKISNVNKTTLR